MKKILIVLSIVATFFVSNAFANTVQNNDGGRGSCRIDGGGYIQANYYEDGRIVVSTESERDVAVANVKVTCTYKAHQIKYDDYHRPQETYVSKTVIIFNGSLYNIPKNQTKQFTDGIKKKSDFAGRNDKDFIYTVTVSNPVCN